jgi:predicted Zn-dependent peptidase
MINIKKLKNGVTLVAEEFKEIDSVSIHILVKSGALNEIEKNSGISHFIEHLAFKGTERRDAKQIAMDFEDIGAHFNASTSKEATCYYAKVLKEYMEKALDILIDMLENSVFDEEELEKEREVILQELAINNDTPDDYVYDRFMETAFPKQQVGRSILGPAKNIKKFQRNDFREYISKNYTAENIIVSVCGNMNIEVVEKILNKLFQKTKSGKNAEVPDIKYVGGYYKKAKKLEQCKCMIGFEGLSYNNEKKSVLKVGNNIFGDSMSSRLFQELREKQGLCYGIGAYNQYYSNGGIFSIYVGTDAEKVNKSIDSIIEQCKIFADKGIDKEELERTKIQYKTTLAFGNESSNARASSNASDYARYKRIRTNEELMEKINSVTNNDVKDLFRKIFFGKEATVALYGNSDKAYDYETIKSKMK